MSDSRFYDRHLRNPRSKAFYNSSDWQRVRLAKLADVPWCERCQAAAAAHVHHKAPITTPDGWAARLDPAGLMPLCVPCHNAIEQEAGQPAAVPAIAGMLEPQEDDDFFFDPAAAERPIKFTSRYVRHHEGKWASQTLRLIDWQARFVRTLYGWRRRGDGRRRFTHAFLLSAKGSGKTPLMSAIGQYELIAGGEQAPHVVSMATDFKQAALTFNWAKRSIAQDAVLDSRCQVTQFEIRHPQNNGLWNTFSGTSTAKSGFRPSLILADEAHEWPSGKAFESVTANIFKREQPLVIVCTNAGDSRNCYAWLLYEEAKKVLSGESPRTDLLPVIFEAPEDLDWEGEPAARLANPSIPEIVTFDSIAAKVVAARGNPAKEAEYRRLHLSQWRRGGVKTWLNVRDWDEISGPIAPEQIAGAPLYVGLDLSEGDDLCAAALVWATPDHLFVDWRLWLPRDTAAKYEEAGAGQYSAWEQRGDIQLLDTPTISKAVRQQIATEIIALHPHLFTYDRYRAGEVVKLIEAAGIQAEPIGTGFGTTPGCEELARRMKEKTLTVAPNAVARAAAEAVEVTQDQRGNFWCVKPNQKGRYAGTRSVKIDPVVALTIALVEARKHEWPASAKKWSGRIEMA